MTYGIKKFQQAETSRGVAWSCQITKDGKVIGFAENSGHGGSNLYHFDDRAEEAAMEAHAKAVKGDNEFEVLDQFVNDLITVMEMNRMRKVAFLLDGDDFDLGQYRAFKANVTFEQAVEALRTYPQFKDKHPKVWDKQVGAFVPVV